MSDKETTDWMPIETAPKDDGVWILVGGGDTLVTIGYWDSFFKNWQERGENCGQIDPAYWMPLPGDPDE